MLSMGLEDDAAREHVRQTVAIIRLIDQIDDRIPAIPADVANPGSELAALAAEVPSGPVDLLASIRVALMTARGSLDSIADIFENGLETRSIVLHSLTRAALASAGRVAFVLLPTDPEVRLQNATVVMRQESASLLRGVKAFAEFKHLQAFKPPKGKLEEIAAQDAALQGGRRVQGEERTLDAMAKHLIEELRDYTDGHGDNLDGLAEHVSWAWHAYSGAAHGYAWPWEYFAAPGSMPGDFVADIGGVVPLAHLAFDLTERRMNEPAADRSAS